MAIQKIIFNYTGANQIFTVPSFVSIVSIKAWGAGGGQGSGNSFGGPGGYSTGNLSVVSGQILTIIVGGGGQPHSATITYGGGGAGGIDTSSNGQYGSSGGGRSAVRLNNGTEVLTAGGGGGSGSKVESPVWANGGSGGGLIGTSGWIFPAGNNNAPGTGGTQISGGIGGTYYTSIPSANGSDGYIYQGGQGGACSTINSGAGGGGGGGYYGGGGGSGQYTNVLNPRAQEGAGGGGSSYVGGVTSGSTLSTAQNNSQVVGPLLNPPNNTDIDYISGIGVGASIVNTAGGNGLVILEYNKPELLINKNVDYNYIGLNSILTYTVTIANNTTSTLNNIVFVDTIPTGTTLVPSSFYVNGNINTGSPNPPGITIPSISLGGISTIQFKVKTANTIPSPNYITNISTSSYTGGFVFNSNSVVSTINGAIVNNIKLVNTTNLIVGDTITYTIIFKNTGNTTANNIVFKDTIPTGTSFIPNSVQINGIIQTGSTVAPPNGLSIPNLGVNQVTTLTFNVIAITIPSPNPTTNTGTTTFNYIVDPTLGTTGNGASNTNLVSTFINNNTNLIKSVNKQYATISDTLTYTLSLKNTLSITQNNLTFIDTIPIGTSFVPNSIKINTIPQIGATITPPNGLSLGTLGIGQSVTVTFDITVNTIPSFNTVLNSGISTFNYVVDPILGTTFTNSNISNTVATTINFANITNLNKQVDKNFATIGDTLTYTISFINIGSTTALNLIFKDTVPIGTTYIPDSFTINGTTIVEANPSPPTGVSIGTIPIGVATTLAFKATVTTIPSFNIIINTGTVYYDYIVNDQTGEKINSGNNTNSVYSATNYADITKPIKIVDKNYADIGTTLTYTITLTNTGNETANNVIFIDTIPNGTSFINNSVQVNGSTQIGVSPAPPTGISIGDIGDMQTSTITFKVIVDTVPSSNPIVNSGTAIYKFIIDPTLGLSLKNSAVTNEVDTFINRAELLSIKSVNESFAQIGDVITYTITFANIGNTTAFNLKFIDTIPNGTTYIQDSFTIDGVSQIGANPSPPVGVNIGTVPAGTTFTTTFQTKIDTIPSPNPILNTGTGTYNYIVDPSIGINTYKSINTNIASTQVVVLDFNVDSTLSKNIVQPCEKMKYTLTVTNIEDTPIQNLIVNILSKGGRYDGTGVIINGILFENLNPNTIIDVEKYRPDLFPLQIHEFIQISYTVIVNDICHLENIEFKSNVIAEYNLGSRNIHLSKDSNIATSKAIYMWESINLSDIICISNTKKDIKDILNYKSVIEIVDYQVIKTPISSVANSEGIKLTGKRLLIIGKLKSSIMYSGFGDVEEVFNILNEKIFTISITVNNNISINKLLKINLFIEDEALNVINDRHIFQYTQISAILVN